MADGGSAPSEDDDLNGPPAAGDPLPADAGRVTPFLARPRPRLLHRALPVAAQLEGYERASLVRDSLAGVTVAALAIPSAMGFAEVAGLPPVTGLYALLLPVVAYALLGTSRQLVVGPEGTSAALVATALAPLAAGDPARYASLAALLALLVGGAYFLARTVRLGWVADYLSRAALVGFMHGVVVILICGQLSKLTGVSVDADRPIGQVVDVLGGLDELSVTTLVTGLSALVALFGIRRLAPRVPGPLLVVVAAIVVSSAADLAQHGVATLGSIPSGLPGVDIPRIRLADVVDLVLPALGIVFATYADSILTARSFAGKHQQHVDADQELLALGVANVTAGLTQSFPIGNSNSRTAVNDEMGVRTQVAGVVSALAVALVLVFLTGPVADLPNAVLGAVIVYSAIGLVSLDEWRAVRAASRTEFAIGLVAMGGVVVFGVLEGILVAVALSIVHVVRRSARPHDAVLGWVPRLDRYADVKLHPSAEQVPGVVVYRLDDRLFFANADYVQGRVQEALVGAPTEVRSFVFDAEGLVSIDSTGTAALEAILDDFARRGIRFYVARMKHPVREQLDRSGLSDRIGAEHFFPTVRAGVAAAVDTDHGREGGSGRG